ncbi:molybdopterin-dependent oxidoreductase [Candidatus Bathyarchaeota archaeon]|nr:molybdopterin-dependent oxidoreductase [Candidatus Bathyarchaeota archaeon]
MSQRRNLVLISSLIILIIGGAVVWNYVFNQPTIPESPTIPAFKIMLVGSNGTIKNITENDIATMQKVVMKGGLKTSAGSIRSVSNYTGVLVSDVLNLVGGITEDNSLRVTAADDYSMVYTWEELSGDFITFDPATGDETNNTKPLIPVLAYLDAGNPLSTSDGPIRFVVLGEEGLITEGHFWVKQTVKIEVIPGVRDWDLSLEGARNETMDRATFESGANCPDTTPEHKAVYVDSDQNIWTGIPVWLLVGRIDDLNTHETGAYNRSLADANAYNITLVAGDGYSVTLNSTFVKFNQNILLANEKNGEPLEEPYWPLRLVGSALSKGQMIRNIVKIQLTFKENYVLPNEEDLAIINNATWSLKLIGAVNETLTARAFIEGAICDDSKHGESWTDSSSQKWFGLPLWTLLGRVDDNNMHGPEAFNRTLADEDYTVRVKASDGFYKDFNSTFVKLNNDLIIAYKVDGKALSGSDAPIKLVGPTLTKGQMIKNISEIEIIFTKLIV